MSISRIKKITISSFYLIIGLVLITLFLLASIKKKVFITGQLEVSHIEMKLDEIVPNFLSINTSSTPLKQLRICTFNSINIPLDSANISILPIDNDNTSNVIIKGACLNELDLRSGNRLTVSILGKGNKMRLSGNNFTTVLQLSPMSDTVSFDLKESFVKGKKVLENISLQFESDRFTNAITSKPLNNEFEIVYQSDTLLYFEEPNTFLVKKLRFENPDKSIRGSTIIDGSIHIEGINSTIQLSKNKKVHFPAHETFEITHFLIKDGVIKINFEGYTEEMVIGHYGNSYVPSILEYLYKNNYLLVLFNSFMTIITFLLFIKRESKSKS